MSQPTTPQSARPARPGYTRRATSSANFVNQLKHLQQNGSPSPPSEETVTGADGKPVTIKNTNLSFSLPADSSTLIPTADITLVATLAYNPTTPVHPEDASSPAPERQDLLYGRGVSDMAIYSFIEILRQLTIPWKASRSFHRRLSDNVVEIHTSRPESLSLSELRRHFNIYQFEQQWNIIATLQPNDIWRTHKRLVVFDLDSTLIMHETIDELAKFVGVEKEVSAITARAMNGELDFTASLKERCKLLNGVPSGVWEELQKVVEFTPGARELARALKVLGYKTAVVSGGFVPLAEWVRAELGLDYAFANQVSCKCVPLILKISGTLDRWLMVLFSAGGERRWETTYW